MKDQKDKNIKIIINEKEYTSQLAMDEKVSINKEYVSNILSLTVLIPKEEYEKLDFILTDPIAPNY